MKVETLNKSKFEPIELKITIESEEELCNLWHRLNLSVGEVNKVMNDCLKFKCNYTDERLYVSLNEHVKRLNLRK